MGLGRRCKSCWIKRSKIQTKKEQIFSWKSFFLRHQNKPNSRKWPKQTHIKKEKTPPRTCCGNSTWKPRGLSQERFGRKLLVSFSRIPDSWKILPFVAALVDCCFNKRASPFSDYSGRIFLSFELLPFCAVASHEDD